MNPIRFRRLSPDDEVQAWLDLQADPDNTTARNKLVEHHAPLVLFWLSKPIGLATVSRCRLDPDDALSLCFLILHKAVAHRAAHLDHPCQFSALLGATLRWELPKEAAHEHGLETNFFARFGKAARGKTGPLGIKRLAQARKVIFDPEPLHDLIATHDFPDPHDPKTTARVRRALGPLARRKPWGRVWHVIVKNRFFRKPPLSLDQTARLLKAKGLTRRIFSRERIGQLKDKALAALRRYLSRKDKPCPKPAKRPTPPHNPADAPNP